MKLFYKFIRITSYNVCYTKLLRYVYYAIRSHNIYVIEGDQQTTNDALRIQKAGAKAIQVNTGNVITSYSIHYTKLYE